MSKKQPALKSGFFSVLELNSDQTGDYPDAFAKMRSGEIQGVQINNVVTLDQLECLVSRLQAHSPAFLKTWFPSAFRSFFYGQNLNLAAPDLLGYFEQAALFERQLEELADGNVDLVGRVSNTLSQLDGGRPFVSTPGPQPGQRYMFATIRGHLNGGYIPAHCENEYPRRRSYQHLRSIAKPHIYSYVLALTLPTMGGELEIFDYSGQIPTTAESSIAQSEKAVDLSQLASVRVRIPAGSLFLFDSGSYLHQLRPVGGDQIRWTFSSFMAMSATEDCMYCWG